MIEGILFDFDGVIMDSMELKLDSYCHALERFRFPRDDIKSLQNLYTGLSRHKVLVLVYEKLSGQRITDPIRTELYDRFADHDESSRSLMSPVPGSLPFLDAVHARFYTAIVTGTPDDVIERTVAFHKLGIYFDAVCGSPRSKQEIVEALIAGQNIDRDKFILIGDGKTDQDAAEACHIRFVGLNQGAASFEPVRAWKVVSSLLDLHEVLEKDCKGDAQQPVARVQSKGTPPGRL
jgi:phosphoglycolate phosphatase-like HAD superfamily hydrolase